MNRIPREMMLMHIAHLVSLRSTCPRGGYVGAVIAQKGRVISTGYSGSPAGMSHCTDDGCQMDESVGGCVRTVHAEANAIAFAARYGIHTDGSFIYCTLSPCLSCAKSIINAGIIQVIYALEYRKTEGLDLLRDAGVEVTQLEYSSRWLEIILDGYSSK